MLQSPKVEMLAPNQFVIYYKNQKTFQSYDSIIAIVENNKITLDKYTWDYSTTTGKYRNQFLGETKKETQHKIDNGTYKLDDLN